MTTQASSTPPSLTDYQSYLAHSRKMDEDPMFTNTLYQRAVADHCLNVDLWKDYLTYLVRIYYCLTPLPPIFVI